MKQGDRIRILVNGLQAAVVNAGDELEVIGRVAPGVLLAESPSAPHAEGWWFSDSLEGEGWERVQ